MRRFIYLSHHWLGIAVCLLMAMWFFSGVVMLYVQYPSLTLKERLAALPALSSQQLHYSADKLLAQLPKQSTIAQLHLTSVQNRPAYLLRTNTGQQLGQFADTGEMFGQFNKEDAVISAQLFAKHRQKSAASVQYLTMLESDQWSFVSGFNRYRPLHRVALNDKAGTELYISSVTGTVVLDTSRKERIWNWFGANIHWLYPKVLRQHRDLWYWLVIIASSLTLLSIFTGAVVGFWRLRIKKPYKKKYYSPYKGQLKLHHILGLLILLPLTTFTYSGLMSMGAFGVPKEKSNFYDQYKQFQGDNSVSAFKQQWPGLAALTQQLDQFPATREVVWYWVNGQLAHYFLDNQNQRHLYQPKSLAQIKQQAISQLKAILPDSPLVSAELLTSYNRYYYAHHHAPVLPVLRIRFNDVDQSWFYIHGQTGQLLQRQTTHSRTMRWLYQGLHRLDFPWLVNNRPWRELTVIVLSALGFVFSISAVVIAWRYLRNPKKRQIKFFKPSHKRHKAIRGLS